jgi:hypothetical protein
MSCCSAFSSFSSLESSAFNSGPESSGRDVTSTYPRASIHRPLCKWSIFVSILSSKSIPMSFDTRKKNSVHIFLSVFIIVCVFHDEVVHTLISKISDKSQKVHVTPICIYIYIQDIASVLFGQGEGDPVSQSIPFDWFSFCYFLFPCFNPLEFRSGHIQFGIIVPFL